MSRVIYKQILEITDFHLVEMGVTDKILTVQFQGDNLCMWYIHTPSDPKVKRAFVVYGTGHFFNRDAVEYIGTAQQFGGKLVWHVFELKGV